MANVVDRRRPLGEAVDRDEATGVKRVVLPLLGDLVVLHLDLERSAAVARHLAVDDEPLASLEDPLEIGLVEPDGGEKAGAIAEQYGQGRPAPGLGAAGSRRGWSPRTCATSPR